MNIIKNWSSKSRVLMETARHIQSGARKIVIRAIDWSINHIDYLVGIGIAMFAIFYLFMLLYNRPLVSVEKKPSGLQGKELQDYLSK